MRAERKAVADHQWDSPFPDRIRIPGGLFRMGSNRHDPEQAPVHRVAVDAFRIDPSPRHAQPIDPGTSRLGFLLIRRETASS